MDFKEQLTKHENILNEFKARYINKDINSKKTNNDILNKNQNSNLSENSSNSNSYNYSNYTFNNNLIKPIEPFQGEKIMKNKLEDENEQQNINLQKIDNLLAKLNFKRENYLNKSINNNNISSPILREENNKINENKIKNNLNSNNNKLDINSIKLKYLNNNNSFNITDKFFNDKNEEKENLEEKDKLNTINNIKKLNQLNARNEIERIKSKYYSMNLNKNNIDKYLNNNNIINNNIINNSFVQLNKEIIELKAKIGSYRNELITSNQNMIKNSINSKYQNDNLISPNNISTNSIGINNNFNEYNNYIQTTSNISLNNNELNNFQNLQFNNNSKYNKLDFPELKINTNKNNIQIDNINNNYENLNNSNDIKTLNIDKDNDIKMENNEKISEYNINSKNNNLNTKTNDFDYSEYLPIIDKVSKLKELNDFDEDLENQKSNNLINTQRTKLTNINPNPNSNEDEDVPNIVTSILDALSNKLIVSNIDYDKEKDEKIENNEEIMDKNKPKLISKNKNTEGKQPKIISFQEFLEKEDKNN